MKKLFLFSMLLCFFAGCSKEETTSGVRSDDPTARYEPHFYGAAMLDNPAPATRGVANQLKVWNNTFAQNLTVKFLNGDTAYQDYVRHVAKEWENYANVKFTFVEPSQSALVRVAFNSNQSMMCSWALTGTDHLQVFDKQTEPTVNFSWRRAADAQKRSDVLRAFGQVLGLELEFRHPNCHPTWITDSEGNINETEIREYWESELGDYITWEELKKMVLDPLENETFFIVSTPEYDSKSVMNWPFYRMLDEKLPYVQFDTDYITTLSEQDKQFIKELYGKADPGENVDPSYLDLVTFETAQKVVSFTLTTTKEIRIYWDDKHTDLELPADASSYEGTINYKFEESKPHKITIAEVLKPGEEIPATSTALTKLDLADAAQLTNIDIKTLNKGLEYLRIIGGSAFTGQDFQFNDMPNLKEIYLFGLKDSKVLISECPMLEVFSTEKQAPNPFALTPFVNITTHEIIPIGGTPEMPHSLSYLSIVNCPNIRTLALVNTHLIGFIDMYDCENLSLVYVTSEAGYLGDATMPITRYLLSSLTDRTRKGVGQVFFRRIEISPDGVASYVPWHLGHECEIAMENCKNNKNWTFTYPDGNPVE